MKKLKNNKGITGIDIVVSITLIVIVLGITMAVYSSYSKKSKEIERTSIATNLAMKVIEKFERMDINLIPDTLTIDDTTKSNYGLDPNDNVSAYKITAKKIESTGVLQNVAVQIDVTVSYNIGAETKKVTLNIIKKVNEVGEVEVPNMNTVPEGCIPVKYVASKNGYMQTNENDSEWYSISSKIYPIVIKPENGKDFDRNGVIQLSECSEIYVWMPSYINDSTYRFVIKEGEDYYKIDYVSTVVNGKIVYYYKKNNTKVTGTIYGGDWQKINASEKPINSEGEIITDVAHPYNVLKNNIFTW